MYDPFPNRIRFTRRLCSTLYDSGYLTERYELIDGEILLRMGNGPAHRNALILVHAWLASVFGLLSIQNQSAIDVGTADPEHNEPVPDLAVTKAPPSHYAEANPGPEDLSLVVEIADTSLRTDRTVKASLYARAGIQEYWVVDVNGRRIYVYRQPDPAGYKEVAVYGETESIATLARPNDVISVAAILPTTNANAS
jgi:Uma2 family endonuclease